MNTRIAMVALAAATTISAAVPVGWIVAGSAPQDYDVTVDSTVVYFGHASASLRSKTSEAKGFGTLMQSFDAERYKGKRVRLSAYAKADQVKDWAGLWMRADGEKPGIAFDNMQNRPIKGTSNWTKYEVVLDIPDSAKGLYFGVLLSGTGTVWVDQFKLEIVDSSVPVTAGALGSALPLEPVNLNFEDKN